ncbi:MAG: ABC transporter ATP-binding protein [Deinococcaceae bacterium]
MTLTHKVPTLKLIHTLIGHAPKLFWLNVVLWLVVHTLPLVYGLTVEAIFDRLGQDHSLSTPWIFVVLFALSHFIRVLSFRFAIWNWVKLWHEYMILIKRNLLGYLLLASGSRQLPEAPGEVVNRFKDDAEDVASFIENYIDAAGFILFAVAAVIILWQRDPWATVVACAPLVLMVFVVQRFSDTIRKFRRRRRQAASEVTRFIGESFSSVQAVQLAAKEDLMVEHMQHLGDVRKKAALADTLLTEFIRSINTNMVSVGTGLILLLIAGRMREGSFTVGDFALFVLYLPRLSNVMNFVGDAMAQSRRTTVSFERMGRILVDAPLEEIVKSQPLGLSSKEDAPPLPIPMPVTSSGDPLHSLSVQNLRALHPSGRGLHGVSFEIVSGSFTVITGRMGSGKTTLLRSLLGLLPAEGDVFWNGEHIQDRASFFVPPRSTYAAQNPRLFSNSLRENILLGSSESLLEQALKLSVLDKDVADFECGVETEVGSRGVKLSGGQLQRTAAARMLAHPADLLVFDDLSSALDAETENKLWEQIANDVSKTFLVVSHRKAALSRATHIIVMKEGVIEDEGSLDELLLRSDEMRAVWYGEAKA